MVKYKELAKVRRQLSDLYCLLLMKQTTLLRVVNAILAKKNLSPIKRLEMQVIICEVELEISELKLKVEHLTFLNAVKLI